MNLCEILGLQPKGVPPYRSRPGERPAYAGMTGRGWIDMDGYGLCR